MKLYIHLINFRKPDKKNQTTTVPKLSCKQSWLVFTLVFMITAQVVASKDHVTDSLKQLLPGTEGQQKLDILVSLSGKTFNNAPDSCIRYATRAIKIADSTGDMLKKAKALYYKGLAINFVGDYTKSARILREAITLQEENHATNGEASTRMALGMALENQNIITQALAEYTRAYELFSTTKNQQGIAQSLLNVGCVLNRKKDYENASYYFQQALDVADSIQHLPTMAAALNNLGILYDVSNQKQNALNYYYKALELQKVIGNKRVMAQLNNNISLVLLDLNKFDEALAALKKSLELKKQINDSEGIANSYNQFAEIYLKQNNYDSARYYTDKALSIADTTQAWVVISQAYKILSRLEEEAGNYEKANAALKKSAAANDTLFNITSSRQIAEMQTRFETNRKEQENMILRQQVKIETDRATYHRSRQRLLSILAVISILSSALLFILLRQRNLSLNKTRTIMEQEKKMAGLEIKARESEVKTIKAEQERQLYENELLEEKMVAQEEINRLEKEKLEANLEKRSSELSALTLHLVNNNEILGEIKTKINQFKPSDPESLGSFSRKMVSMINQHIDPNINWKKFRVNFDEVHPGFFDKLQNTYPGLTANDLKLCAFLRVNLQSKEIAQIMNVSLSAVNKGRQRLRKNLDLPLQADLHEFLSRI